MPVIPHAEIWSYLYNSHIGVIPFCDLTMLQKNTPTKLFEFMASECAIVASSLLPISSYGKNSISYSIAGNVNSLVDAIELYLMNIDTYKKHININKKRIIDGYNWDCVSDRLINIYRELM